jgi:hypothetical protein
MTASVHPGAGVSTGERLKDRRGIDTFYGQQFRLTTGLKDTMAAALELYQPSITKTRRYAKLELKAPWNSRKRDLSKTDRRAMGHLLRELVAQAAVPTFRRPKVWNGLRVRPKGRVGRTEQKVAALLKNAPNQQLSFNKLTTYLRPISRRNLRASVLGMDAKGVVVVGWRGGRLRSVRLRTLTLIQQVA